MKRKWSGLAWRESLGLIQVVLLERDVSKAGIATQSLVFGSSFDIPLIFFRRGAVTSQLKITVCQVDPGNVEVRLELQRAAEFLDGVIVTSGPLITETQAVVRIGFYSFLRAVVGSNAAARSAGSHEAMQAISRKSTDTKTKVAGSVAFTSTNMLVRIRVSQTLRPNQSQSRSH